MTCRYCGNEIRSGAAFCPHCGAVTGASPETDGPIGPEPPGYPAMGTADFTKSEVPSGRKKAPLIAAAAAAVAVIALIAVAAAGLFASPKGQVERALAASAAAYASAGESLGIPDISQWQRDRSIFQSIALELTSINSQLVGYDLSALSGLGIGMSAGYSGEDRYMAVRAAVHWGADELFSFQMVGDDDELYFQSSQLAGETYYGVSTETLGADLARMTGDDSVKDISFNLFDLIEIMLDSMDPEVMEQAVREANKALWEAAQVKKEGAKTLEVNGTSTKTTLYQITFPQQALEDYADALAEALSAVNSAELYRELFQSMGIPQEETEDFLDELERMDPYGELAATLKEELDEFGDLELDLCLSGGYVSAVLYEGELWGEDVELALYLGGDSAYVDDLSVELTLEDTEITVKSSGDHGLKGGVYTDKTTLQVRQFGASVGKLTSDLRFDPSMEEDNFQWELAVNSSGLSLFGLEAQGSLSIEEDILDLTLEDLTCKAMELEVCGLRFHYRISRCPERLRQPLEHSRLITEMDTDELEALGRELERSAEAWVAEMGALFLSRLPAELFYSLYLS